MYVSRIWVITSTRLPLYYTLEFSPAFVNQPGSLPEYQEKLCLASQDLVSYEAIGGAFPACSGTTRNILRCFELDNRRCFDRLIDKA